MKRLLNLALIIICFSFARGLGAQESLLNNAQSPVQFFFETEAGFVGIPHHTLQQGKTSATFNYVTSGGQNALFPFYRFTAGCLILDKHKIAFLYQPLSLITQVAFSNTTVIDGVSFSSGTPVNLTYDFPFYRASYTYRFFDNGPVIMGAGFSLQIRNATIGFQSGDGSQLTEARSLGPVPAINFDTRYQFSDNLFLAFSLTGFYASSAFLNGADYTFEGSILDSSIRVGYILKNRSEVFLNLRFLGGSAKGENPEDEDTYTENYLATIALTLGFSLR